MNTVIVYASKYGCTEKCARIIAEHIGGGIRLHNVKSNKPINLDEYHRVVIGSSIYVGRAHREIREFCSKNLDLLRSKELGLFICCMEQGETALAELDASYPQELRDQARARDYFGGEIIMNKLNTLDRLMAHNAAKIRDDMTNISMERIERFCQSLTSRDAVKPSSQFSKAPAGDITRHTAVR